jgi:hypothetical protein
MGLPVEPFLILPFAAESAIENRIAKLFQSRAGVAAVMLFYMHNSLRERHPSRSLKLGIRDVGHSCAPLALRMKGKRRGGGGAEPPVRGST